MGEIVSERGAKVAASRLRITVDEYLDNIEAGERWCGKCKRWLPKADFWANQWTSVGVGPYCRRCASAARRRRP